LIAVTLTPIGSSAVAAPQAEPMNVKSAHPTRSAPGADKPSYDPRAVLVKFRSTSTNAARQRALTGGGRAASAISGSYARVTSDAAAPELLRQLKAEPAVELAQLDYQRKLTASPNDQFYRQGRQNYLNTIRLPEAWNVSKSAGSQTIAILDTGIDLGHPDLAGRIVGSYNAVSPGSSMADPIWHGTFVAGIAGATTNNTIGVAGAAWNARLLPVKVFDSQGNTSDSVITRGIDWAVAHGARIINLSLGGSGDGPVMHDAIKRATAKGVLVVAAAGNTGEWTPQYPAAYPEALAVGATDWSGALTGFSSVGDWVDIAAPGWNIGSTYPRPLTDPDSVPYAFGGAGTSFSAPMVAGVAALVRNKFPTLTPAQVMARLKATARDAGPRGLDPYYGAGLLDAYNALGGRWAAELPMGSLPAPEPNDMPARATAMAHTSITGAISVEGDVDWYSVSSAAARKVVVTVTPPTYDEDNRAQNLDPILAVYDAKLQRIGYQDSNEPEATERLNVTLPAGAAYISVNNYNGSRDSRTYTLSVAAGTLGSSTVGSTEWIWNTVPSDFASNVALTSSPVVTFQRDLDPATVNTSTVRLLHGKTGGVVPSSVTYNVATKSVTIKPNAPLQDNTPYQISIGAVYDTANAIFFGGFSSFRTVNNAPTAITGFDATGRYASASLTWSLPPITDLDQVIVRRNTGTTPPSSPTTGTAVYAGTAAGATATGLANSTSYAFRAWVQDRSGKLSPPVDTRLVGTRATIATNTGAISYGGSVSLSGKVTRLDTGAPLAGVPVSLYARTKNSTVWREVTRPTSSATGTVSYVHKPTVSTIYQWGYNGSPDLLGSRTADKLVEVRPTITAYVSSTAIKLGGTNGFYGYLRPQHSGQTVYLQRSVSGSWTNVATTKLNSTGNYGFSIKPTTRGTYAYRAVWLADGDHATTVSVTKTFTVS
jgi:serine protease